MVENPISEPIVTADPARNEVLKRYFANEKVLYASMTNSAEEFGKASKFWLDLANPDGTINSAYGHLIWQVPSLGHAEFEEAVNGKAAMRTPWEWAIQSLLADIDTRQAVMPFALPHHYWRGNKDQVCTMHGIFQVRNSQLNFTVVMRSNDITFGLAYDMPWFIFLQDKMLEVLKPTYPGLSKGKYTHFAHSLHLYESDFEKARLMLGTHGV